MSHENSVVHIYTAHTGKKTCNVEGKHLHSQYKPEEEALRIVVAQQNKQQNAKYIELVIILGASLGYEMKALNTLYPNAKIIGVFFHIDLYNEAPNNINHKVVKKILYNDAIQNTHISVIQEYFTKTIANISLKNIAIVQWTPASQIWHKHAISITSMLRDIFERQSAEKNTACFFMKQWLSNTIFHYLHLNTYKTIAQKSSKPVLVIGAGPTMPEYLSYIKTIQDKMLLVATSSSLSCMYAHEIFPDIIVHQDSSYYASTHLAVCKQIHHTDMHIAMPMHAGRSEVIRNTENILMLDTGQDIEALIPMPPCIKTLAYGTVMGTALELSWQLSKNKVYLIGFDASIDIHGSHCFPHSTQDAIRDGNRRASYETATRMPYVHAMHTLTKQRHNMPLKQTTALRIYSQWFEKWNDVRKKRTYILVPNTQNYILSGFTPTQCVHQDALTNATNDVTYKIIKREAYQERKKIIATCIKTWKNAIEKKTSIPQHVQNTFGILKPEIVKEMLNTLEYQVTVL